LKETFIKINEAVGYFGTMIPSVIILPRLNVNWNMCCHGINKFYNKICKLKPNKFAKYVPFMAESELQAGPSSF
jgi:hypothetical protein